MECPHCGKHIEVIDAEEVNDSEGYIDTTEILIRNLFIYLIPFGYVISLLDSHTNIPLSIEDGLVLNYGVMLLLPIALFVMVYVILYRYGKVKGRFLYKG